MDPTRMGGKDAGDAPSGQSHLASLGAGHNGSDITNNLEPLLSKNQRKRLLKAEIREKAKRMKKERRKEEKKKATRSARPRVANVVDSEGTEVHESRKERKLNEKREFQELCKKNFTVIIDLAWEDKHQEKALKSLKQQVMYCYGFNKRHTTPAQIHLTGIGPKLRSQLIGQTHADNWIGFSISDEEYVDLPALYSIKHDESVESKQKKQLVYLTSDAEETLETLDENCAYIIGGIVDRNRYKGITHGKAVQQGIRTAKLPIRENYQLSATHVLTVNHVFEILLNVRENGGDWKAALEKVLPKRKEPKAKVASGNGGAGEGDDDNDGDDDASSVPEGEDEHDGGHSDLEKGGEEESNQSESDNDNKDNDQDS